LPEYTGIGTHRVRPADAAPESPNGPGHDEADAFTENLLNPLAALKDGARTTFPDAHPEVDVEVDGDTVTPE